MDDRINRIKPDKEVDRDWQETVSTISAVQEGAVPENGEEKNKYLFEKIGPLKRCGINWNELGESKGTAEVEYFYRKDAFKACRELDYKSIRGVPIRLEMREGQKRIILNRNRDNRNRTSSSRRFRTRSRNYDRNKSDSRRRFSRRDSNRRGSSRRRDSRSDRRYRKY